MGRSKNRFITRWRSRGAFIFDTKVEEYYENIIADYITLREMVRVMNALDKKNELAKERIKHQCDVIRELKKELKEHDDK